MLDSIRRAQSVHMGGRQAGNNALAMLAARHSIRLPGTNSRQCTKQGTQGEERKEAERKGHGYSGTDRGSEVQQRDRMDG